MKSVCRLKYPLEWFDELVENIRAIWIKSEIEKHWAIGDLILKNRLKFKKPEYGNKTIAHLAIETGISKSTLYDCIKLRRRYPSIEAVYNEIPPGGKLTWRNIRDSLRKQRRRRVTVQERETGVEYATHNIRVFNNCLFNCRYCYSKLPLQRSRLNRRVPNPTEEAKLYAKDPEPKIIMIDFCCDPYPTKNSVTRKVLEILGPSAHQVMVLTKNPRDAMEDIDVMSKYDNIWFGSSVTSLYPLPKEEPKAPCDNPERIECLKIAKEEYGLHTFISTEPWLVWEDDSGEIIDLTRPWEIIEHTHSFIDYYIIGALNYREQLGYPPLPKGYYKHHIPHILYLLMKYKKMFFFKKELRINEK